MKILTFFAGLYGWACVIMLFIAWPIAFLMMAIAYVSLWFIDWSRIIKSAERYDQRKKVLALQAEMEKYRK
jgi:hypothetical protein